MSRELVSVVMPVYEPVVSYLAIAVESVLAQSHQDLELLVVEDGPRTKATEYLANLKDPRVRLLRDAPGPSSIGYARNRGLSAARGKYVAWLDGDDIAEIFRLETQLEAFEQDSKLSLLGSRIEIIDERGRHSGYRNYPVSPEEISSTIRVYNTFCQSAIMLKRDEALALGGFPLGVKCEDYELWCKYAAAGKRMRNLARPVVKYRIHPTSAKSNDDPSMVLRRTVEIKQRYLGPWLTPRDRRRIAAERVLMHLPGKIVRIAFRAAQYDRALKSL